MKLKYVIRDRCSFSFATIDILVLTAGSRFQGEVGRPRPRQAIHGTRGLQWQHRAG